MKSQEQQELRVLLSGLDARERRDLFKQAARRRQEAQAEEQSRARERSKKKERPHKQERGSPEGGGFNTPLEEGGMLRLSRRNVSSSRPPSLDEILLDLLKRRTALADPPRTEPFSPRVIAIRPGICRVETADGEIECILHRDLRCQQQTLVAVGDHVELDGKRIIRVLPRRNRLSRPEPGNPHRERVMAANIDLAVIVVSSRKPALHPGLIDRILVALEGRGIPATICLNKIELAGDQAEREAEIARLDPFKELGIPVYPVSAALGDGLSELRRQMSRKTCVFLGHSGVGKSSLVNALAAGSQAMAVGAVPDGASPNPAFGTALAGPLPAVAGEVRGSDGRGRHTTTSSCLHRLPEEIAVIDTPGIREFGLSEIDPAKLPGFFPEFRAVAAGCRFRDCRHLEEPECAVCEAVRDGRISRHRYQQYRRILGSLEPEGQQAEFACIGCGERVPLEAVGTTQRNHCPSCLWSRHLDQIPGDRAAACGGAMEPIAVWVRKGGEWAIVHRCSTCGVIHANRVAGDDNEIKLLSLAVKPLSQPPFPLDRLHLSTGSSATAPHPPADRRS